MPWATRKAAEHCVAVVHQGYLKMIPQVVWHLCSSVLVIQTYQDEHCLEGCRSMKVFFSQGGIRFIALVFRSMLLNPGGQPSQAK